MSLEIGKPSVRVQKRIKIHYVAILAVATIALSVVISLVANEEDVPESVIPAKAVARLSRSAPLPQAIFYLVDSPQQAARVDLSEDAESRLRYENGLSPDPTYRVFVIDSLEAEAEAMRIIAIADDDSASPGRFVTTVIDKRVR